MFFQTGQKPLRLPQVPLNQPLRLMYANPRILPTLPIRIELRVALHGTKPLGDPVHRPGLVFIVAFELGIQGFSNPVVGHPAIGAREDYEARLLVVELAVIDGCALSDGRADFRLRAGFDGCALWG
jgi:hypothetical protein